MSDLEYEISCQCGGSKQTVKAAENATNRLDMSLCHCTTCRHVTGVLFTSYLPIQSPTLNSGIREYCSSNDSKRYFCTTCGCHLFQRSEINGLTKWCVATGVVSKGNYNLMQTLEAEGDESIHHAHHINIADTKDGGLSTFLNFAEHTKPTEKRTSVKSSAMRPNDRATPKPPNAAGDVLEASCHCGKVAFHITRPDDASRKPHSGLPDLMVPHKTGAPEIKNTEDYKWWLRPSDSPRPTHYMAGTCACKSCRLTSGFEIQTWAFVPRSNIMIHISGSADSNQAIDQEQGTSLMPLDFTTLPQGIVQAYESSPGVLREFCGSCGATIFWHDRWRPDIIDVSVGLLKAPEGSRAEDWLEWWKTRVSFEEDAGLGRSGVVASNATSLVKSLARGMITNDR